MLGYITSIWIINVSTGLLGTHYVLVLFRFFSSQVLEDAADFHFKMEMGSNVFPQWKQWNSPYSMFKISHSLKKDLVFAPKSYILLLPGLS